MRLLATRNTLVSLVLMVLTCGCAPAQCTPEWSQGLFPIRGTDAPASAMCVYNGELYVGGKFTVAGGVNANRVARWNGRYWQTLDTGVGGGYQTGVLAMCAYNGELYAGGDFTTAGGATANYIAKWNGTSWQPVGAGLGGVVYALCTHNGELFVGGNFTTAGGATANYIAKWDGTSWQPAGTGMNERIFSLCVYNGQLYAAGGFFVAGGVNANCIAKWDGVAWHDVGTGVSTDDPFQYITTVQNMCVYNGELYAVGEFNHAGGVYADGIARWDGVSWRSVSGLAPDGIGSLCLFNGELYAGGYFYNYQKYIARWNGISWQSVGTGMDSSVCCLCEYNDGLGSGPALYAGGYFTHAGGNVSAHIARWGCENALTDPGSARSGPDGRLVSLAGNVSTAAFGDAFYASDVANGRQVSGIRVAMAGHGLTPGMLTNVTGRTRTDANGERYIEAWSVSTSNSALVQPHLMALSRLGGGPVGPLGQEGITGAFGLNNIGSLVRACGRFTYIDASNFTLDDGSGIAVRCVAPAGTTLNPLWQYVAVTGISSCERVGDELHARVLVRSAEDVQAVL